MAEINRNGRVTIPTDNGIVRETLDIMKRWGADALRDCDGTDFPQELKDADAKIYATYYTTRKDNAWAKAHPEEVQQCYIMTAFSTAEGACLTIPLMKGISRELIAVNERDDPYRWWEVMDRTAGEVVPPERWHYADENVAVQATPYHAYTVSFLAYLIWDPVHMYNAVVNQWQNVEHQITFDVRQPLTHAYSMERLKKFLAEHPYVDVVRYTTFFHQFTLLFDELKREKYVDWYGYSASVSPYILKKFEHEVGYRFRPEYIIDQGYYNNQYRVPSRQYLDFVAFQRREVAKLAKEMVDITHAAGKEAMMFLGDHWIGTEPFMPEFQEIGLDAVVGSVGNGATLRLISDIPGVKYTEGRFLPYFFPDTFHPGGDPVGAARENWLTARRAMLRSPVDRIGYGGYLKLALEFPEFVAEVEKICSEFRTLYANVKGSRPVSLRRVAVLNCWGKMRAWGCHMVHHALYYKQNYSYAGAIEMLAGAPFDVQFISYADIQKDPGILKGIDTIIMAGDADTAHTGGTWWENPAVVSALRRFVYEGGGMVGIGEPSGHQYQGHFIQMADVFGVEKETGLTLNYDKYNWEAHPEHFLLKDAEKAVDFGEAKKNMYALPGTTVLVEREKEVQLAVHECGRGRGVYISGIPYTAENARLLYRAVLWSSHAENLLDTWFSTNCNVEVNAYTDEKYCAVNNTDAPQETEIYTQHGRHFPLRLAAGELRWFGQEAQEK